MANDTNGNSQQAFARELGDALRRFLNGKMGQSEAAKMLELYGKNGKPKRSTLNSYFHDREGKRTEVSALVLFLACTKLGFAFDYDGFRIRATKLGEKREQPVSQMAFSFEQKFDLAENGGNVDVKVKRPPGRIELHVSLDAKAR